MRAGDGCRIIGSCILANALTAAKLGDWSWDAGTHVVTFSERAAEPFNPTRSTHDVDGDARAAPSCRHRLPTRTQQPSTPTGESRSIHVREVDAAVAAHDTHVKDGALAGVSGVRESDPSASAHGSPAATASSEAIDDSAGRLTASTAQGASRTTSSATLPITSRATPLRPACP